MNHDTSCLRKMTKPLSDKATIIKLGYTTHLDQPQVAPFFKLLTFITSHVIKRDRSFDTVVVIQCVGTRAVA